MNKFFFTIISFLALTFLTNCSARKTTPTADPLTTDIGVTINGITWATRNVDAPGTFAANPEDAGMFFQWNRRKGWNATDEEVEGWDNSYSTGTEWYAKENDPCPKGWRVPTTDELRLLINAGSEWIIQNGVNGRIFGTVPNQIFIPTAGAARGTNGEFIYINEWGFYWSDTQNCTILFTAWNLQFSSNGTWVSGCTPRSYGMSIRCVKI